MGTMTPIHDALVGMLLASADPTVPLAVITLPALPALDEEVERVVDLARREAFERGHASVGTGHLLLGLVRAAGAEACLLAAAGVTRSAAGRAMALVASSSVSEPVTHGAGHPVDGPAVAEVLAAATAEATVTPEGVLHALLARPWGQVAEMLAALGVDPAELADAGAVLAGRPAVAPRPTPRDPSGLLSSSWRREAISGTGA